MFGAGTIIWDSQISFPYTQKKILASANKKRIYKILLALEMICSTHTHSILLYQWPVAIIYPCRNPLACSSQPLNFLHTSSSRWQSFHCQPRHPISVAQDAVVDNHVVNTPTTLCWSLTTTHWPRTHTDHSINFIIRRNFWAGSLAARQHGMIEKIGRQDRYKEAKDLEVGASQVNRKVVPAVGFAKLIKLLCS